MFVDLLVTVVEYTLDGQTRKNIKRKGFCSNYLADLEIGSDVAMYLRSSPSFHLPDHSDGKRPLLLGSFNKFNSNIEMFSSFIFKLSFSNSFNNLSYKN